MGTSTLDEIRERVTSFREGNRDPSLLKSLLEDVGDLSDRVDDALAQIEQYSQIDGSHHKAWCIDQTVRSLTKCPLVEVAKADYSYHKKGNSEEYDEFVRGYCDGEDGPDTYEWDEGIAP